MRIFYRKIPLDKKFPSLNLWFDYNQLFHALWPTSLSFEMSSVSLTLSIPSPSSFALATIGELILFFPVSLSYNILIGDSPAVICKHDIIKISSYKSWGANDSYLFFRNCFNPLLVGNGEQRAGNINLLIIVQALYQLSCVSRYGILDVTKLNAILHVAMRCVYHIIFP